MGAWGNRGHCRLRLGGCGSVHRSPRLSRPRLLVLRRGLRLRGLGGHGWGSLGLDCAPRGGMWLLLRRWWGRGSARAICQVLHAGVADKDALVAEEERLGCFLPRRRGAPIDEDGHLVGGHWDTGVGVVHARASGNIPSKELLEETPQEVALRGKIGGIANEQGAET